MLLRSDGAAVACGLNSFGQCNLPELDSHHVYINVAAGTYHTVLLIDDGRAVACGLNTSGQCNLPELEEGLTYTQAYFCLGGLLRGVPCGSLVRVSRRADRKFQCPVDAVR